MSASSLIPRLSFGVEALLMGKGNISNKIEQAMDEIEPILLSKIDLEYYTEDEKELVAEILKISCIAYDKSKRMLETCKILGSDCNIYKSLSSYHKNRLKELIWNLYNSVVYRSLVIE